MIDSVLVCCSGYQTAYSKLMFAGKKEHDPVAQIPEAKLNLAKHLHKLSIGCPGKVTKIFCYISCISSTFVTVDSVVSCIGVSAAADDHSRITTGSRQLPADIPNRRQCHPGIISLS